MPSAWRNWNQPTVEPGRSSACAKFGTPIGCWHNGPHRPLAIVGIARRPKREPGGLPQKIRQRPSLVLALLRGGGDCSRSRVEWSADSVGTIPVGRGTGWLERVRLGTGNAVKCYAMLITRLKTRSKAFNGLRCSSMYVASLRCRDRCVRTFTPAPKGTYVTVIGRSRRGARRLISLEQ